MIKLGCVYAMKGGNAIVRIRLTLYKKVILLIISAIFVSLLSAYALILGINDTLVAQRIENGSKGISARLSQSEFLKRDLLSLDKKAEVQSFLTAVSESTVARIAIFGNDGTMLFASYPFIVENEGDFLKKAREEAFSSPMRVSFEDDLRTRSYYSTMVAHELTDFEGNSIGTIVVADLPSDLELKLVKENLFLVLLASLIGLIIGIFGAIVLVKNTKDTLLGLEPEEIAQIMQERSAMIDSVQEGILCVDISGIITLVNSSARKIFEHAGLKIDNLIGVNINQIYNSGIGDVLSKGISHINYEEKINRITVITNQVPVIMGGEIAGAITTFRLKTEMEVLAQQLTGVQEYADALRAQTHEFQNKMHVILGLIKIQAYDELREYIKNVTMTTSEESQYVLDRLKDPLLSGFVIGKISRARELDIDFSLTEESSLPVQIGQGHIDKIVSIIGNLLNNAFDALKNYDGERIVLLTILIFEEELLIIVEDSGPGIPKENIQKIFAKGFSTKKDKKSHGFGLHLVRQALEDYGGTIEVESLEGEGTIFTVRIPNIICEEKIDKE